MNTKVRPKILLVEDNPGDVKLMENLLKNASFRHDLYVSDSLFDAFENLRANEFDLVLLDLSLPDSTGFKTLTTLLDAFPSTPVVVLTGVNNEIVGSQSVKAGAQDFLVKGQFDNKILGRAIRYAIQRHQVNLKLKESAKALAISEKRFLEAQEIAKFGNWDMDIVSNSMTWGDELYRIFGLQPRSINPSLSDYINFVHSEDKDAIETFFEEASQKGQERKIEHRILVDGRNIKHVGLRAKIYFDENQDRVVLMGVVQDITERKLSEQLQLEKSINKQATKLKEDALTDIGFHIRTPLSSIYNLLYVLENSEQSKLETQVIGDLKTSVSDLSIMVNNLMNASLLVSSELQVNEAEFDLKSFWASTEKMLALKAANAQVDLDFHIDHDIPESVIADGQKFTQIIYNLCDAVLKPDDTSRAEIAVRWYDETQELNVEIISDGQTLTSEEISDLLTNRYVTPNEIEESSNQVNRKVNFSIINILSQLIDGTVDIAVTNQKNRYSFSLPLQKGAQDAEFDGSNPNFPIKVLLVEDHFLNQIATKKVLTTWSELITVDVAENGLIGVEKFKAHGYDIILMDIQMPVMDGIEATRKIRESNKQVPIIALTANASKVEEDNCIKAGMNSYISKPFKPEVLQAKITSVIRATEAIS